MRYYREVRADGYIYSIDNVRLVMRGNVDDVQRFMNFVSEFELEFEPKDYQHFFSSKIRTYAHMFKFSMGDSAVALGVDFIDARKHDSINCFMEFNPNKVSHDCRFPRLLNRVRDYFKEVTVSRWDLAIDMPVKRDYLRIEPDNRNYETIKSQGGFTEYLGIRNKPGRVKLYDKTKESELDFDLTRLEITVDGFCEISELRIPKLLGITKQLDINAQMNLSSTDLVLYRLLLGCDNIMSEFKQLGRDKQKKLKPYLFGGDKTLGISLNVYSQLLQQLREYEIRLFK